MPEEQTPLPGKTKLNLAIDLRTVVGVLLVVIAAMLLLWKPWNGVSSDDRTVTVSGEASLSAEPDEYVFYPSYQFKHADKDTALGALTKKSDIIVAELKKLGVEDKNIKTNSGGSDYPVSREPDSNETTYTLTLTVTAGSRDLAQKIQDYLLTTSPTGAVSPQPSFSDAKRQELETKARDQATKAARAKADQSAKNLGFSLGKVKSVTDGTGFGDIIPLDARSSSPSSGAAEDKPTTQLTLQPGQNDLTYSVTVVYYVR